METQYIPSRFVKRLFSKKIIILTHFFSLGNKAEQLRTVLWLMVWKLALLVLEKLALLVLEKLALVVLELLGDCVTVDFITWHVFVFRV